MKNLITSVTIILLLITGCSGDKNNSERIINSESDLQNLVLRAINGYDAANDSLSGLINLSLPVNKNFNSLKIEKLKSNKEFYGVLLEYPNPAYNRFAVYKSTLNSLIIDQSLTGNLFLNQIKAGNKNFIQINEEFKAKDVFNVSRLSLYEIRDTTVNLAFRTFIKLETPDNVYYQKIVEFDSDMIKTNMSSKNNSSLQNKSDIFLYDDNFNRFINNQNVFSDFVKETIDSFNNETKSPQILDYNSMLKSTGIEQTGNLKQTESENTGKVDYSIILTQDWEKINNIEISGYLKKPLNGTKFINNVIGAQISVIQIPYKDSAESYIDYNLESSASGKYLVNFTQRIEDGKNYVQFFEYSCKNTKYLMIFEASKYTWDKYKETYANIINSFNMDC